MSKQTNDPVTLYEEGLHLDDFPGKEDRWEDIGILVTGQLDDGQHFKLLEMMGVSKGRSGVDGLYLGGNSAGHYTQLVLAPADALGRGMIDNNFIRKGWLPNQLFKPEDLKVTVSGDTVRWALDGRTHEFRQGGNGMGIWRSKGSYANVELDLTHTQTGDTIRWECAKWGTPAAQRQGLCGLHALCDTTGSMTVNGKKYGIRRAVSVWEHITLREPLSMPRWANVSKPVNWYWIVGGTPEFNIYMVFVPERSSVTADVGDGVQIVINGESIDFLPQDGASVLFTPTKYWDDPRTGIHGPCAWQAAVASTKGTLLLNFEGFARGSYPYPHGNGTVTLTLVNCRLTGEFRYPDGRIVKVPENATMAVEWSKLGYVFEETLNGPVC